MHRKPRVWAGAPLLLCCLTVCTASRLLLDDNEAPCNSTAAKWDYDVCPLKLGGGGWTANGSAQPGTVQPGTIMPALGAGSLPAASGSVTSDVAYAPQETLGFKTGGAQDIENFRTNLEEGYLPLPTDLTYEGLVKDYFFNTTSANNAEPCTDLFCPIYSVGMSPDPLRGPSSEQQFYTAVGLDSGMKAADFARKKLNLVVVLDVSGSMMSSFDTYYYDQPGSQESQDPEAYKSKLDVAKEVLLGVVDQLDQEDSLGIVLFSDAACVPKPLGPLSCADVADLKSKIERDVISTSATSMASGLDAATEQLMGCQQCREANKTETENRIIFITDAQPNTDDISENGLLARIKALAADGIYTTLIGVGLDFNTELVESIIKVKGANYYSVHTPGEFKRRLNEEFDYAVTPLVFDLTLKIDAASLEGSEGNGSGWKILHVYGSPNPNDTALSSDGGIMKVHTLFPSPKTEEGIKGGVVLLRLQPPSTGGTPLVLEVTYEDREGKQFSSNRTVELPDEATQAQGTSDSYYESSGVQKAVALARYTDALHGWLLDQWSELDNAPIIIPPDLCGLIPLAYCAVPVEVYGVHSTSEGCYLDHWLVEDGCVLPPPPPIWYPLLGRWERQSRPLAVSDSAKRSLKKFLPYFEGEVAAVNDTTMSQEVDLLKKLIDL